jgi:four helix bundle protein
MAIALKEANETEYWLELLHETKFLDPTAFGSIHADITEFLKLLTSIINSTKRGMDN